MSSSGGVQPGGCQDKQRIVTQMAVCMLFVCACSDIKASPCGLKLVVILVVVTSVSTLVHLYHLYHILYILYLTHIIFYIIHISCSISYMSGNPHLVGSSLCVAGIIGLQGGSCTVC